jgi:Uma2 family endonuclease
MEKRQMSTIADERLYTPADLLAMPDAIRFELVNGELVERNASLLSGKVEILVATRLQNAAESHDAGDVWGASTGCRFYPDDPDKIRKPDATFVRRDRFSSEHYRDGFLTIRPDIVVEVVSTNDRAHDVFEKIEEYLSAEVPLVWVVDPERQIVHVHRQDGTVSKLHATDELTGEDVFPEYRCRVADFFPRSQV